MQCRKEEKLGKAGGEREGNIIWSIVQLGIGESKFKGHLPVILLLKKVKIINSSGEGRL